MVLYLYLQFGINSPDLSTAKRLNLCLEKIGVSTPDISFGWIGILTLRAVLAWCWIIGFLGFGSRVLNFENRFLTYANEAVLPFYILHQTILLIIGYFIIQWSSGIATKYMIITATSFVVIMAIYEFLVRRVNTLRFLFGLSSNTKI